MSCLLINPAETLEVATADIEQIKPEDMGIEKQQNLVKDSKVSINASISSKINPLSPLDEEGVVSYWLTIILPFFLVSSINGVFLITASSIESYKYLYLLPYLLTSLVVITIGAVISYELLLFLLIICEIVTLFIPCPPRENILSDFIQILQINRVDPTTLGDYSLFSESESEEEISDQEISFASCSEKAHLSISESTDELNTEWKSLLLLKKTIMFFLSDCGSLRNIILVILAVYFQFSYSFLCCIASYTMAMATLKWLS
ncbi:unnamed protein product [Moneuplotes crassus]|uniref:Uncharacterized protein n=1 Tax=Euplotes crassus TaxID=5936 RepID=A0AAD1UP86_EUPCR|nr:unnamed protein product [Moneuplotes crassus]